MWILFICTDGFDGTDCYGMPGRSPNSQFTYPAFTFPGNGGGAFPSGQVKIEEKSLFYWVSQFGLAN